MSADGGYRKRRRSRDDDDTPPVVIWPAPCRDCIALSGLREIAWHHRDRQGRTVVASMMAGCDCALGQARAERTVTEPGGRRILGTVRVVWERMALDPAHVQLFLDPTVAQRSGVQRLKVSSAAIEHAKATMQGAREGGW